MFHPPNDDVKDPLNMKMEHRDVKPLPPDFEEVKGYIYSTDRTYSKNMLTKYISTKGIHTQEETTVIVTKILEYIREADYDQAFNLALGKQKVIIVEKVIERIVEKFS